MVNAWNTVRVRVRVGVRVFGHLYTVQSHVLSQNSAGTDIRLALMSLL